MKLLKVLTISWLSLSCLQLQAAPYQLYLVRHAHKAAPDKTVSPTAAADPALSACGQAQAKALATLLAKVPLHQLYHTEYLRSKLTATALLSENRQLDPYPAAALSTLATLLQQRQQTALVVGHSNTVPQLVELLSQQPQVAMTEQDYGWIYQLQFDDGGFVSLTRLQLPMPAICQTHV